MKGLTFFYIFFLFSFIILDLGQAQVLEFSGVLKQALSHSYDLKASRLEIEISKEQFNEAQAIYYPTLTLRFNEEYIHNFDGNLSNTVSVGETIIPGNESTFQNSVVLSGQYLLYDFGKRKLTYQNAQRDILLSKYTSEQRRIDYAIEVLYAYGTGLQLQKKIETGSAVSALRKYIYQFTKLLVESGTKGKLEQGIAAIGMADALQNCDALRLELIDIVEKLSFYTGREYQTADVQFSNFPDQADTAVLSDTPMPPGIRAYNVAIEQKKAEIDIARRHWLPTISLYTSYRMYGNNKDNFVESVENLEEKNATIGFSVNMNLFNGFGDEAKVRRLENELKKLEVEKAKEMAENDHKVQTLIQKGILSEQCLKNESAYRIVLNTQEIVEKRLSGPQVLDRISLLQRKEEQIEKLLSLALADVDRCMNTLQLKILAGEYF